MLVITLGDPFSINVAAVDELMKELERPSFPVVVVGSHEIFKAQSRSQRELHMIKDWSEAKNDWNFFDLEVKIATTDPMAMSAKDRGVVATKALYHLKNSRHKRN